MANNYYNFPVPFVAGTKVRSEQINTQYQGVEAGFDLLSTDPDASIIGTSFFGTDVQGATVNEYLITTPDPRTPLVNGQRVSFFATHSNDGAVTLNVDGSGLVAGVNLDGDSIVDGQLISGQFYEWVYDNANTQWLVTKGISGLTDPLLLSNGSVGAPTYSFELDPDTGMFQNGADILGFAAGGFLPAQVDASNGAGNLQLIITPDGPQATATFPALAFGDGDTGFHEPSDDQIAVSLAGSDRFFWAANVYGSLTGAGPAMLNEAASSTNPTLVPDRSDIDTGLGQNASGEPSLIGNGVELARGVAAGSGGLLANNTLTGGGLERVLTTGDAGGIVGDVFKVGTPVNDQVGVWTGDGTIEGTAGLTYDGSTFNVSGDITLTGTVDGIDIATDVAANTAKVTNATHTGQVTGATALALDVTAITAQPASGAIDAADTIITNDGGVLSEASFTQMITFFDANLAGGGGIGDVFKVGTPVDNEIGVWTGDGTIEGDTNFQWDGSQLLLAPLGSAATPTLGFGDGDTGFFESIDDTLQFTSTGVARFAMNVFGLLAIDGDSFGLFDVSTTATDPTLLPRRSDTDSGIGQNAADELSLIAGGVEGLRLTELNSGVIQAPNANVAVTAFAGGGQGSATQLDSGSNVLTTVATIADSVKLPPVFAINSVVFIKNDGANAADVFPASGDDIGNGVDTAFSLAAGASMSFIATVANSTWTQWIIDLFASGAGDVFKVGTPVNDQLAVWTGDGTLEGNANFNVTGTSFLSTVGNGPAIRNVASGSTTPTLIPRQGDLDTGIANAGDDRLSLVAGGQLGMQLVEASGGVIHGFDIDAAVTAFAGGGQGSATQLNQSYNIVTTVATTGDSIKLPPINHVGGLVYVKNNGANSLDFFPASGDDLGLGVDTALSVSAGAAVTFMHSVSNTTWTQIQFEEVGAGAGDVFKVGTPVDNEIGVWTGDGTIEGDPNFTWDGNQLSLPTGASAGQPELRIGSGQTGFFSSSATQIRITTDGTERFTVTSNRLQGFLAGSAILHNAVASDTLPTLTPSTNDTDSGLGSAGADELAIIAGGVQIAQAKEAAGANQFIVAPGVIQDAEATPSLAFGDGDTGFYEEVDDTLAVSLAGVKEFEFGPLAGADAQFGDVELLTNLDGADGATTFTEQSNNGASATFVGTAELDTAEFKFGTASLLLDGNSDYIEFPDLAGYDLGTNLFTIEGWVRFNSLPAVGDEMTMVSQWSTSTSTDESFAISLIQDGLSYRIRAEFDNVFEQGNVGGAPALNTWFHFAAQRSAGDLLSIWFDGNLEFEASVFGGAIQNSTETLKLGVYDPTDGFGNEGFLDGWVDDVRITIGSTRYTTGGSITPPTTAFPTNSGQFTGATAGAGKLFNQVGSLTTPTLAPRNDDDDTGIGGDGDDVLSVIVGGVEGVRFTELNDAIIPAHDATLAVTAFATGGQGSATQLDSGYVVLGTVATAGDSVKLPPVFAANSVVYIKNDGANAADVFPASGDDLGAGTDTAVSVKAGSSLTFIATVADTTWTQLLVDTTNVVSGGLLTAEYRFSTTTTASDPGPGRFRYNNATPASVTAVFIDDFTNAGIDISNLLSLVTTGDRLYFQTEADGSEFLVFDVTATITDNTGWFTITGTVEASGTLHGNNDACLIALQIGGAGVAGDVFKVGTPVDNEIGVWTGDGTLEGDTNFQFDGSQLLLLDGTAAAPAYSFVGDPDTGMYIFNTNTLGFTTGGTARFVLNNSELVAVTAGGALIRHNAAASATVPVFVPDSGDIDTGIGQAAADQLSLIAGGVEVARLQEVAGDVQLILPQDNTPLLPTLAFGDGDTGFYESTDDFLTVSIAGTARFEWVGDTYQGILTGAPALINQASSATVPTLIPSLGDVNTGIGHAADDQLSLIAGGAEIARAVEDTVNQFLVVTGTTALPGLAFLNDPDTGVRREDTDRIGFIAGGVVATLYQEGFGTGVLASSQNDIGLTASVTQTQAGGLVLRSSYNEVSTVATSGDALTLQGPPNFPGTGIHTVVINNGANDLQLFPALGDDIGGTGVNASVTVEAGAVIVLLGRDGTNWDILFNGPPSPSAATVFPEFQFGPNSLLNPNNADWTVNALAPAVADSNNAGLTVRLFDDTTEEGVGFQFEAPVGATNIIFTFRSRAETTPGGAVTVGLNIYNRGIPDNAAVQAWSAATQLTDIDLTTNEFFQEDSQSVTLATLGVTAGELTQFELTRVDPTGGSELSGDWTLGNIKVSFS